MPKQAPGTSITDFCNLSLPHYKDTFVVDGVIYATDGHQLATAANAMMKDRLSKDVPYVACKAIIDKVVPKATNLCVLTPDDIMKLRNLVSFSDKRTVVSWHVDTRTFTFSKVETPLETKKRYRDGDPYPESEIKLPGFDGVIHLDTAVDVRLLLKAINFVVGPRPQSVVAINYTTDPWDPLVVQEFGRCVLTMPMRK